MHGSFFFKLFQIKPSIWYRAETVLPTLWSRRWTSCVCNNFIAYNVIELTKLLITWIICLPSSTFLTTSLMMCLLVWLTLGGWWHTRTWCMVHSAMVPQLFCLGARPPTLIQVPMLMTGFLAAHYVHVLFDRSILGHGGTAEDQPAVHIYFSCEAFDEVWREAHQRSWPFLTEDHCNKYQLYTWPSSFCVYYNM